MDQPENPGEALALQAAVAIQNAFQAFQEQFTEITRRSRARFESRDWHAVQTDAVERLELYPRVIRGIVREIGDILGTQTQTAGLWAQMRSRYARLIAGRNDIELAETFFNSVTRRIFTTVGVDASIEFIDSDFELPDTPLGPPIYYTYRPPAWQSDCLEGWQDLLRQIAADYPFAVGYRDLDTDIRPAAELIYRRIQRCFKAPALVCVELLKPVFYRNNGAYLVGRIRPQATVLPKELGQRPEGVIPLVFCLQHYEDGLKLDAALLDEDDVSIIFSFTRSYFHVEVEKPHALIGFLKSIMPLKRIAELYISIGYNKHGKTELYRDLIRHLERSTDKFHIAPGERGMVMAVFTMNSYDMVFKVIKDRVDPPKTTTRQEVMDRYDLVFKHDRAGRLVDAQEFEYLSFEKARFNSELLQELLEVAPNMVSVDKDWVNLKHLYIERRTIPLNLFVKEADEVEAASAIIDYGQAIKDLAATNIFPGDVLLKNFGVTRHGRVVFYDYDELCLVTDCKFRRIPQARNFDDEFEADPWFYVGPMDIFPEEFRTFLGLQEPLRSVFIDHHEDLFGVEFWKGIQKRQKAGEVIEILPYAENLRLGHSRPEF